MNKPIPSHKDSELTVDFGEGVFGTLISKQSKNHMSQSRYYLRAIGMSYYSNGDVDHIDRHNILVCSYKNNVKIIFYLITGELYFRTYFDGSVIIPNVDVIRQKTKKILFNDNL